MMKKRGLAILAAVTLLTVVVSARAMSDSVLGSVYDAGKTLLFNTSNVTLKGTAEFSLDGTRFKGVQAEYMQDGYNSSWKYQLFTPRKDGSGDRESGFTVIANENTIYVMETLKPGTYRLGYDAEQNTLVQRSPLLDQVVELAGILAGQAEGVLGADAVTVVTDNHTGRTVKLSLKRDNISDLMNVVYNICVQMAIKRGINPYGYYDADSTWVNGNLYSHGSIALGIANTVSRYDLRSADVTVTLDGNGNLRSASGIIVTELVLDEESRLEGEVNPHVLEMTFDVTASAYGTTLVPLFYPEEAGLRMERSVY